MNITQFIGCFDKIRVQLNSKRASKEQWPISTCDLASKDDLRKLYLPWYYSPKTDAPVCWCNADAQPLCVGRVADNLDYRPQNKDGILKYACCFRAAPSPIRIKFPVYNLHDGKWLLLDGNHRAVALALVDVRFEVTLL